jgi:hypothetical protein
MLKIGSVRWKGRCSRHRTYNPAIDGLGGIRGGCRRCELLLDIYTQHMKLVALIREFGTRDEPKPDAEQSELRGRQMSLLDLVN